MRKIYELRMGHEVWLVGKGPSLDGFNWDKAGKYRISINETVFLTPSPYAAIAIDYDVLDKYRDNKLQLPIMKKSTHGRYSFDNEYIWEPSDLKYGCMATAPIAIQLLALLGVSKIHFVGFDSMHGDLGYADAVKGIKGEGHSRDGYKKINEAILDILVKTGITPVWEYHAA